MIVSGFVPYTPSHVNHLQSNYLNDPRFFLLYQVPRFKFRTYQTVEKFWLCATGFVPGTIEINSLFKVDRLHLCNTDFDTL